MTENAIDFYLEAVERASRYRSALIEILEISPWDDSPLITAQDIAREVLELKETNDKKRA